MTLNGWVGLHAPLGPVTYSSAAVLPAAGWMKNWQLPVVGVKVS